MRGASQENHKRRNQVTGQEEREDHLIITCEIVGETCEQCAESQTAFVKGFENAANGAVRAPAIIARR